MNKIKLSGIIFVMFSIFFAGCADKTQRIDIHNDKGDR